MEDFMKLYEQVYKDLYRIALYYMGNATEAEDAVGDAVLKAYEHFNRLKNRDAFRSWIIKILINTCKKRMRSWFRKNEELDNANLFYEKDLETAPLVSAAMEILSQEERLIVALYVFGGYIGEEIAQMLGIKHSTVRSKYHRALFKMKKYLEA